LDRVFNGEIKALGHPGAALLAFSMSLIAFNALRVVRTAMAAVHGQREADQVSEYYLTELVLSDWRALNIFASPEDWTAKYGNASPRTIASALKNAAKHVDMERIRKTTRGPKKPQPKHTFLNRKPHVSTYRVLKSVGKKGTGLIYFGYFQISDLIRTSPYGFKSKRRGLSPKYELRPLFSLGQSTSSASCSDSMRFWQWGQ
jgi:hypothetical protein